MSLNPLKIQQSLKERLDSVVVFCATSSSVAVSTTVFNGNGNVTGASSVAQADLRAKSRQEPFSTPRRVFFDKLCASSNSTSVPHLGAAVDNKQATSTSTPSSNITPVLQAKGRRASEVYVADQGVEQRANSRISDKYGDKVHVNATSYNRMMLLTGEVPTAEIKADVEKIAAGVPNIKSVSNNLTIAGPSSFGVRSNDSYITSKVMARFIDAGKFPANVVKVVTEAGAVFLLGIVTQAEADAAVEIARTTGGVLKVVRSYEIVSPEEAAALNQTVTPPAGLGKVVEQENTSNTTVLETKRSTAETLNSEIKDKAFCLASKMFEKSLDKATVDKANKLVRETAENHKEFETLFGERYVAYIAAEGKKDRKQVDAFQREGVLSCNRIGLN